MIVYIKENNLNFIFKILLRFKFSNNFYSQNIFSLLALKNLLIQMGKLIKIIL